MGGVQTYRFPSPLRYPGGKGKVSNFVKLLMLQNGLVGSTYAEPYAGGASVALSLLYDEYASHVLINDINPGLAAFWRSVLSSAGDLCELIRTTPVSVDTWEGQRETLAQSTADDLALGFATFFLNRTSRSGILNGGLIGGRAQDGKWRLDARYNSEDLCRRIMKVHRFRSRITFTQVDAEDFLRDLPPDNRLVYLDPPYFVRGAELYLNFYADSDHARVADLVKTLPGPWIVSYDVCEPIAHLYKGNPRLEYSLSYSASAARVGTEWMFFSSGLAIPEGGPVRVPQARVDQYRLLKSRVG